MENILSIDELTRKINIVLESERISLSKGQQTYFVEANNINYVNSDRLLKIYDLIKHNNENKNIFLDTITNIINSRGYNSYDPFVLILYTLLRLNESGLLLEKLNSEKGVDQEVIFSFLYNNWGILKKYFNSKSINLLIDYTHRCKDVRVSVVHNAYTLAYPSCKQLYNLLISEQVSILDEQLDNNFQYVEQDFNELKEKIKNNKFDDKLILLIDKINETILSDPDEIIVAGLIGNFREALRDFIEQLAEKIRISENDPEIPRNGDTKISQCRNYLKDKFSLTDTDSEIFKSFHKFLDSFVERIQRDGGHSYYTNTKSLKFVRNIGISLILFLTDCYELYTITKKGI